MISPIKKTTTTCFFELTNNIYLAWSAKVRKGITNINHINKKFLIAVQGGKVKHCEK